MLLDLLILAVVAVVALAFFGAILALLRLDTNTNDTALSLYLRSMTPRIRTMKGPLSELARAAAQANEAMLTLQRAFAKAGRRDDA
jgi:hypothetical protein